MPTDRSKHLRDLHEVMDAFAADGDVASLVGLTDDEDAATRAFAVGAIRRMEGDAALEGLVESLGAEDELVRFEAAMGLLDRRWDPVGSRYEHSFYVLTHAWDKLYEIGLAAVPEVRRALNEGHWPKTRGFASAFLGLHGVVEAKADLIRAFEWEEDEVVACAILQALVRLAQADSWGCRDLERMFAKLSHSPFARVRMVAYEGMMVFQRDRD
jgi:HEAT repeat protein